MDLQRALDKLDEKEGKLIQIYCVIELDELYEIYKKLYQKKQGKEEFLKILKKRTRENISAIQICSHGFL